MNPHALPSSISLFKKLFNFVLSYLMSPKTLTSGHTADHVRPKITISGILELAIQPVAVWVC